MYLVNTEITVNWTPESFSVSVGDYIRPSIDTLGFITHRFTPTTEGLWELSLLVSGTIVGTQNIFVTKNETSITKFVSAECLP
jgi:hypothetical protein